MNTQLERKAREFAEKAHAGQVRKGTTLPYVTHPIAVAGFVKQGGGSEEQIAAAYLHDVLEDCDVSEHEIEMQFGASVLRIVKGCSETDKKLPWHERKKATLERLKTADPEVLIVSCADKLHNLESTLSDYRELGEKLWERFNAPKADQLWYYEGLLEIFQDRNPKCSLTKRYIALFEEFKNLAMTLGDVQMELNLGQSQA